MTVSQQLSLAFKREQTPGFDLPVGFGHAQCMFNLEARYMEITCTHSHQISIFQSSNNWTCAVQIIVSAAVLNLDSFNEECIDHNQAHVIIKIQAARFLTGTLLKLQPVERESVQTQFSL